MLIATHIGEISAETRRDREAKSQARKADEKRVPDLLGNKVNYLLCLGQVSTHEAPPPIHKELLGVFKSQNLMMMQKALDNTTRCLSVHATIIATPDLIKLNLYLCFCMEH